MRVGTQTLIQALQALPWTKDLDNDDEILNQDQLTPSTDSESDEDDKTGRRKIISLSYFASSAADTPCSSAPPGVVYPHYI